MTQTSSLRSPPLEGGGPINYSTCAASYTSLYNATLYFKIYTTARHAGQLMSIAGYEAFVCVCFFAYKKLCTALHMAAVRMKLVFARMCVYTAGKQYYINLKSTGTRTNLYCLVSALFCSHTHKFHPLSTIVNHTFNFAQVQSMDDNCGEWMDVWVGSSECS